MLSGYLPHAQAEFTITTVAEVNSPTNVATDDNGNLYIGMLEARIQKVDTSGSITTLAGNGMMWYGGDGGLATAAQISIPISIEIDDNGNVYFADFNNHRVRMVNISGIITTIAGVGSIFSGGGYSGDGSTASQAQLNTPGSIVIDNAGNLYIADSHNNRIRKIDTNGTITTIAGSGSTNTVGLTEVTLRGGYSGDGGLATAAEFNVPGGLALDSRGNLYVTDTENHVIRKIDTSNIITTVAGNGIQGYSGDGELATTAQLNGPQDIAIDSADNLYIADHDNHAVRMVTPDGIITTIAGNGSAGYSGDDGLATLAQFHLPQGIAIDSADNLYIADNHNNRIRKLTPKSSDSNIVKCTYSIEPTQRQHDANANNGSVNVTAPNGCDWTIADNHDDWLTITSSNDGTVNYSIVTNDNPNSRSSSLTIAGHTFTVNQDAAKQSPTASFTVVPNSGEAPLTVNLDASASNDPDGTLTNHAWTASNGETTLTASGKNANFTFDTEGSYTVMLTVTDNDGLTDTSSETVTVAKHIVDCTYSIEPSQRQHDANANNGSINVIAPNGCDWTTTDNHDDWLTIASSNDGIVNYSIIANDNPNSRSSSLTIAGHTFTVNQDAAKQSPTASFTVIPNSGDAPLTVVLDASASNDPDGTLTNHAWTASNGKTTLTASGKNTNFTFDTEGSYTVMLTVTDNDGLTGTSSETVTVSKHEIATVSLEGLEELYIYQANIDKVIEANLIETVPPTRTQQIDVWASIKAPSGKVFFLTAQTSFSLEPQPFKTSVPSTETSHKLLLALDEFPEEIGGEYTLSALYVQTGKNPVIESDMVHRSNLVTQTTTIANASPKSEPKISTPAPGSTLNFGESTVGSSVTQDIVIRNYGDTDLVVDLNGISGKNASDFGILTPNFPLTISNGDEQTVTIQCTPSENGLRVASLQISSNFSLLPTLNYGLECEGIMPTDDPDHYLAGTVQIPAKATVNPSQLEISWNLIDEVQVNADSHFVIERNFAESTVVSAFLEYPDSTEDEPHYTIYLEAIVFEGDTSITLNAHSTTLALVWQSLGVNTFVLPSDHIKARNLLAALTEVRDLGDLLETKLADNPYLLSDNSSFDSEFMTIAETAMNAANNLIQSEFINETTNTKLRRSVRGKFGPNAIVTPADELDDIKIYERDDTGNITIENDTQLYLSVKIISKNEDGTDGEVLLDHIYLDENGLDDMVGPQGWWLAFNASEKHFEYPDGKNCTVEVITPGMAWEHEPRKITEGGKDVREILVFRTYFERAIWPIVNSVLGPALNLKCVMKFIFSNTPKLVTDITEIVNEKLVDGEILGAVKESRELFAKMLFSKAGIEFILNCIKEKYPEEKIAKFVAKIDKLKKFFKISLIEGLVFFDKTLFDLNNTDDIIHFQVTFPNIDSISPNKIFPGNEDIRFTISGKGFKPLSSLVIFKSFPTVRFTDINATDPSKKFMEIDVDGDDVNDFGTEMKVTVDGTWLNSVNGPIEVEVFYRKPQLYHVFKQKLMIEVIPRFTDNGNGTVTDNKTGLIWLQNANCDSFSNRNGKRTLSDSLIETATLRAKRGGKPSRCNLKGDANQLGDWRIPDMVELRDFLSYVRDNHIRLITLEGMFNKVRWWKYWSVTIKGNDNDKVWLFNMEDGTESYEDKYARYHVWPVHSRFTDNANGTVTDNQTGLIWLKDANCYGDKNWHDATSMIDNLKAGKCDLTDGSKLGDWYIPKINEFFQLLRGVHEQSGTRAQNIFNHAQREERNYWTSTNDSTGEHGIVFINSATIQEDYHDKDDPRPHYVWPVRSRRLSECVGTAFLRFYDHELPVPCKDKDTDWEPIVDGQIAKSW